jgi:hypothetical protein
MNLPARELEAGYGLPWETDAIDGTSPADRAIVAVDARGLFVALSYSALIDGIVLSPFQTEVPLLAQPVMRGVSRVAPGSPLAAVHDLLLRTDSSGRICGVSALSRSAEAALHLHREEDSRDVFTTATGHFSEAAL